MKKYKSSFAKLISCLTIMALIIGVMPWTTMTVRADGPVGIKMDGETLMKGDETWSPTSFSAGNVTSTRLELAAGSYVLQSNIKTPTYIKITGNVTLDLNGYGILESVAAGSTIAVVNGGSLTINDSNPAAVHYIRLEGYRGIAVDDPNYMTEVAIDESGNGTIKVTGGYITGGSGSTRKVAYRDVGNEVIDSFDSDQLYTYGGGIYLGENVTVNLNGGNVSGNKAHDGGGIFINRNNASVIMNSGASISYNKADRYGGGIVVNDEWGNSAQGTLVLNDGTISHNLCECSGVVSCGGGVYVGGKFTMTGGSVSDNAVLSTTSCYGGGVYLPSQVGQGAQYGGTFLMSGGSVEGNTTNGQAGGVMLQGYKGIFRLSGGAVKNNRSTQAGGRNVGGILVQGVESFFLSGSPEIEGNYWSENGTGARQATDIVFSMNGYPINLEGPITNSRRYGVANFSLRSNGDNCKVTNGWNTHMSGQDPADYFVSQSNNFHVELAEGEGYLKWGAEFLALDTSAASAVINTTDGTRVAPRCGDVLTTAAEGTNVTYQWYRGDEPISGATAQTYTVQAGDVGSTIKVKAMQAKDTGGSGKPADNLYFESDPTEAAVKIPGETINASTAANGVIINYNDETATPKAGFEVSVNGTDAVTPYIDLTDIIDGGNTPKIYVRIAESGTQEASNWVELTLGTRPDEPSGMTTANGSDNETANGRINGVAPGMEFSGDGGVTWTGITSYAIAVKPGNYLVRYKATASTPHSASVEVTVGVNYNELNETNKPVTKKDGNNIGDSAPVVGDTLTAATAAGPVTYQWYRGDEPISGATNRAYTIQAEDVGKTITVKVTQAKDVGGEGMPAANVAFTTEPTSAVVKKPAPSAPEAPIVDTVTCEVVSVSGCEYGYRIQGSSDYTWTSETVLPFTPGKTYEVVARVKETGDTLAGEISPLVVVNVHLAATVNGEKYASLSDAVNAAAGKTIVLADDVNEDISANTAVTLDLNGKTINGSVTSASGELTVTDSGTGGIVKGDVTANTGTIIINSGYFDHVPAAIASGQVKVNGGAFSANPSGAVTIDATKQIYDLGGGTTYRYMIGDKPATEANDIKVSVGETTKKDDAVKGTGEALTVAQNAADSTTATGLEQAAVGNVSYIVSESDAAASGKNIVIVPSIEVNSVEYDTDDKQLTMDIDAVFKSYETDPSITNATQVRSNINDDTKVKDITPANNKLNTEGTEVALTVRVPDAFAAAAGSRAYVQHEHGGKVLEYKANISGTPGSYNVNFTNPNGFSTFTITLTSESKAELNGKYYVSIQDAIDDAADGATIVLQKDEDVNGKLKSAKTIIIDKNGKTGNVTITAGSGFKVTSVDLGGDKTQYTASSSGVVHYYVPDTSKDTYTMTFDTNGGMGSMGTQDITGSGVLTLSTLTREGYTFIGWNTKPDGTGTMYKDGDSITPSANLTLYAQWKKNEDKTDDKSDVDGTRLTTRKRTIAINAKYKVAQYKDYIKAVWGQVEDADYYVVYVTYCGKKFGDGQAFVVRNPKITSITVTGLNGKALNLKKNYKLYVIAYKKTDSGRKKLTRTVVAHIVGRKSTKYANVNGITLEKTAVSFSVGKTYTIKGQVSLTDDSKSMLSDNHAPTFRFLSSDEKVATVTKKGKIKALGAGTCYVYVYAKNGYAKKVKVKVK